MDSDIANIDEIPDEIPFNDNTVDEISEKRGFTIRTISLENLEPPKKIIVKVELNGKYLGKSEEIDVKDNEVALNWKTFYELSEVTETVIGELMTHPLVFTVLSESITPLAEESVQDKKGVKGKTKNVGPKSPSEKDKSLKEKKTSTASKKTNKSEVSKSAASLNTEVFPILGVANLDIVSLLTGQEEIVEVLFINPITEQKGSEVVAWANLVKLNVSVTITGNILDEISRTFSNILTFTVESLCNITLDYCNEDVEIAVTLPINQILKFRNGILVLDDTVRISNRKKWYDLRDLPGNGALSLYKVPEDTSNLLNTMDYEVTKNILLNKPRIQWNQLHRSCLNMDTEDIFKEKIMMYKCWPVEIIIPRSSGKTGKHENIKKTSQSNDEDTNHYITFLDLSRLMYPGEKTVRLTSQLYTYTEELMKRRFKSLKSIYEDIPLLSNTQEVKPKTASSKKGSTKSKKDTKKDKKKEKVSIIEEIIEDDPLLEKEPEPLFNDNGEPIFIVIGIDLFRPLVEKRMSEQVLEDIYKIIPKREKLTPQQLSTINTSKMYEECIKSLIHKIHDEYQIFFNINEMFNNSPKNFLLHLQVSGAYAKMAESMKEIVNALAREMVGPVDIWCEKRYECQDLLTTFYQEMTNKMYTIVDSFGVSSVQKYDSGVTSGDLEYFISEALEEDDYDRAHNYLLLQLEKSEKADPQVWIDFAIYWKRKLEFEKAEECAKEAISLEPRHKNSLLFHGLLSWLTEDFDVAEIFLLSVVSFNPDCLEGWITLYIMHKQMGKQKEAEVELLHAKECLKEFLTNVDGALDKFLLSWCAGMTEVDRIFLLTATKLLKFSFPELAELALSHDLLLHGRVIGNLYYLAVCHYHQGRYTSSLVHLEEALKLQWEEERLWSLKGHNLYKLQKLNEAKETYNVALNFKDQEDQHLINLRLGNILLQEVDYKGARSYYMICCKKSPTPLSWLGLGISAFMDDDIESAELALSEANMLDCKMGRVWGYLSLVNLMMDRTELFNKCIMQALKYGFDDKVLMEKIDNLVKLVQPRGNES